MFREHLSLEDNFQAMIAGVFYCGRRFLHCLIDTQRSRIRLIDSVPKAAFQGNRSERSLCPLTGVPADKMLQDARMAALAKLHRSNGILGQGPVRAASRTALQRNPCSLQIRYLARGS